MEFLHQGIEEKWKKYWNENQVYKVADDFSKPKFYVLDMFPYPSGAGLHVGHPLGYIASDIVARHKRMSGFNVLHPMGFDAFGLPAEQYAIQTGIHPSVSTAQNIQRYREQLDNIGFNYDWSREVITCDPNYYKWTQWIFLKLYNSYYNTAEQKAKPIEELVQQFERFGNQSIPAHHSEETIFDATAWNAKSRIEQEGILMNYRLAFRKTAYVNWCEALGTVLANDEIKDGVSERGGHPVEKKPMMQWALRITAYAERLLKDMETLEWSDSLKIMQSNWIGKSIGAQIFFAVDDHPESIEIFTTRPDTIFGASFMVLAPEHPLVLSITTPSQKPAVEQYINHSNRKTERERQTDNKSGSGVFTGAYAIHPFNQNKIPIWIADYVLIEYGTGAIMAVPSNDKRDQLFAKHFDLPIVQVVDQSNFPTADLEDKVGIMINSDFLNGKQVDQAITEILEILESKGIGKTRIQYKLRDANFSRQRYWGEPFPIYYDETGQTYQLSESELPLELPHLEQIEPGKSAKSPLASATDWVNWNGFIRETDTMPGYAGSSWYFLRYMDPDNKEAFASKDKLNYWKDVDLYIGGTEHAVGHLMYSRFWHKFLFDYGFVNTNEPFKKLVNQGMIQGNIEYIFMIKEDVNIIPCDPVNINSTNYCDKPTIGKVFVSHNLTNDIFEFYKANNINISYAKIILTHDIVEKYKTILEGCINNNFAKDFEALIPEYKGSIYINKEGIYYCDEDLDNFDLPKVTADFEIYSEIGKMSKRYKNVINPDDIVNQYGADCFRMYEMFLGPIDQAKPWDTKGIDGVSKFLRKFYNLFYDANDQFVLTDEPATQDELKILHTCIKKVNQDIEQLSFNTSVSAFMICVNELKRLGCTKREVLISLAQLLAPFAPFITEEIWHTAGYSGSIHHCNYPQADETHLIKNEVNYPVSINGKKRFEWIVAKTMSQDELLKQVVELDEIKKWLEGQEIKKIIIVPNRMINIVI